MSTPQRFQSGFRLEDGNDLNTALATPQWQTKYGITALAGGALSAATPVLTLGVNVVTTVATANDSVVLPRLPEGSVVYLLNADSTDAVRVYAAGGATINGTAGATGVTFAAGKRVLFISVDNGIWIANVMSAT